VGSSKGGRPAVILKEVINAIFYVVKTDCSWRSIPHDLPCWQTVYGYFNRWSKDGTWDISTASLQRNYAGRSGGKPILQLQAWTRKALKLQLAVAITEVLMQARILKATVARA
jgi:transposase